MYTKYGQKLINSFRPCELMISTLLETIEFEKQENRNDNDYFTNANQFKTYLLDNFNEVENASALEFFEEFSDITEYISSFEEKVKLVQERDRFYSLPADRFTLKVLKSGKRFFLKANWMLISIANLLRTLFKKKPIEKQFWEHNVREKQLAELVYRVQFLEKINGIVGDFLQFRQEMFQRIKTIDATLESAILLNTKIEADALSEELHKCKEDIQAKKEGIELFFRDLKSDLDKSYKNLHRLVGTIEFSSKTISARQLKKKANQQLKKQDAYLNSFERRSFALFEHWRLVYEIRFAVLAIRTHFAAKEQDLTSCFDKVLIQKDIAFVSLLETAIAKIDDQKEIENIQDGLLSQQLLKEGIFVYIEKLMETDFVSYLDDLKTSCSTEFESTKAEYLLPVKKSWNQDIGIPKLRETNVSNIVTGCLEEFIENPIVRQKSDLINGIQLSLSNAEELTGIVEYSLEYYKAKSLENEAEQQEEFAKGIERAVKKAKENKQYDLSISNKLVDELNKIKHDFSKEIANAISPDNLNQKQTEMIRKKRIRDYKNSVNSILTSGKEIFTKSHVTILSLLKQVREKYTSYREALGLVDNTESIGSELSNYLSETEKAIASLPLMYQHLFKITPLTNAKFRVGRPKVLRKLEMAYSNWTNGKFAPTCLVGETGSGMTSTLNIFEERFGHQYPFYRFDLEERIVSEEGFIEFMKLVFSDLKFENIDELIDEINKLKGRRMVVIENIQQLFIRKMHGSKNLILFFKLISQSNSKVFWLSTCLLYTYKYLDYTMKMHDYYGHVINLDTLTKDDLTDVITKRHKFSGFKLNFLEPNNFKPKRAYKRMTKLQKQDYLQEDYFKQLYNYSHNNLSLAFLFWMRSIVNVEDNIFDLQYRHIDYSFFTSLSNSQIATLHSLLLHGSLNLEEHIAIFDWQKEESFAHLMVFVDDGILIKKGDDYFINPLVYRQLVNHLDVLNYVH